MDYHLKLQTVVKIEKWKWLFLVGLVALTHLFYQSLILPYRNALLSLLHENKIHLLLNESSKESYVEIIGFGNPYRIDPSNGANESLSMAEVKSPKILNMETSWKGVTVKEKVERSEKEKMNSELDVDRVDDDFDITEDESVDAVKMEMEEEPMVQNNRSNEHNISSEIEETESLSTDSVVQLANGSSRSVLSNAKSIKIRDKTPTDGFTTASTLLELPPNPLYIESLDQKRLGSNLNTSNGSEIGVSTNKMKQISDGESQSSLGKNFVHFQHGFPATGNTTKKKMACEMPPKTVTAIGAMERLLVRHRAASRAMRPRWSSERDKEILAAKVKIEQAPALKNDPELYTPLFRNVSTFKRSYELMERVLKVYVYKEGEKPIFHQPILKGLYASEGWFMKLMETNKHFVVKNPRKAHLFYMPFSTRMLEYTLYVRNSHNRTNLRQYLKDYSEKIAAKYSFWNRLVEQTIFLWHAMTGYTIAGGPCYACANAIQNGKCPLCYEGFNECIVYIQAPYETRHHMEHCIKALCNADVTMGFKIGRDISLPETYVRSARNPLRDLGGKPPSQRNILAFYAGNNHGYLRPILLKHWNNKEPDMKVFGPMPAGVASKMNYIYHMKSSKYCICPKGYEVNSPRIIEAIFYECVPVIISDNFVPPCFEVLNWNAFSLIIKEKDIPNLRNILVSIPEQKYLNMQLGVCKIQQHFLWHAKPVKYDLFHMILHSIWYNRVFQIKTR